MADVDDVGVGDGAVGGETFNVVGVGELAGVAVGGLRTFLVLRVHDIGGWAERHFLSCGRWLGGRLVERG